MSVFVTSSSVRVRRPMWRRGPSDVSVPALRVFSADVGDRELPPLPSIVDRPGGGHGTGNTAGAARNERVLALSGTDGRRPGTGPVLDGSLRPDDTPEGAGTGPDLRY